MLTRKSLPTLAVLLGVMGCFGYRIAPYEAYHRVEQLPYPQEAVFDAALAEAHLMNFDVKVIDRQSGLLRFETERLNPAALAGDVALGVDGPRTAVPDFHVFHRYAANFPWVSHGMWFLQQMRRWLETAVDVAGVASEVYRPDLYRDAARELGVAAPDIDLKREGVHATSWVLETSGGPITMGADTFFDGKGFDPLGEVSR